MHKRTWGIYLTWRDSYEGIYAIIVSVILYYSIKVIILLSKKYDVLNKRNCYLY